MWKLWSLFVACAVVTPVVLGQTTFKAATTCDVKKASGCCAVFSKSFASTTNYGNLCVSLNTTVDCMMASIPPTDITCITSCLADAAVLQFLPEMIFVDGCCGQHLPPYMSTLTSFGVTPLQGGSCSGGSAPVASAGTSGAGSKTSWNSGTLMNKIQGLTGQGQAPAPGSSGGAAELGACLLLNLCVLLLAMAF